MTHCSKDQRDAIVNQFINSDLLLREFAQRHGIAKPTLYTWSRASDVKNIKGMKKRQFLQSNAFQSCWKRPPFLKCN